MEVDSQKQLVPAQGSLGRELAFQVFHHVGFSRGPVESLPFGVHSGRYFTNLRPGTPSQATETWTDAEAFSLHLLSAQALARPSAISEIGILRVHSLALLKGQRANTPGRKTTWRVSLALIADKPLDLHSQNLCVQGSCVLQLWTANAACTRERLPWEGTHYLFLYR